MWALEDLVVMPPIVVCMRLSSDVARDRMVVGVVEEQQRSCSGSGQRLALWDTLGPFLVVEKHVAEEARGDFGGAPSRLEIVGGPFL